MGNKVVDKVLSFLGFDVEEEVEEFFPGQNEQEIGDWQDMKRSRKSNVVSLRSAQQQVKMVFLKPQTFEEVQEIADYLKDRRPVILNLELTEKEVARRIVDFLSGSTYSLAGSMQKLSTAIFLFLPQNMDITGQFDEGMSEKNIFAFINSFSS